MQSQSSACGTVYGGQPAPATAGAALPAVSTMTVGGQAFAVLAAMYSPEDLTQCLRIPDASSVSFASKEFVIKSMSSQLTYKNNATSDAILDLYQCYVRKDIPWDMVIQAGTSTTQPTATGTLLEMFLWQGLFNLGVSPAYYGITPFQSPLFCEFVKILKKNTIQINPGGKGSFTWTSTRPRLYNSNDIGYQMTGGINLLTTVRTLVAPRGCMFYLAIVKGTPSGATAGSITSTLANVDFINTERYDCRVAVVAQTRLGALVPPTSGTFTTEEEFIPATTGTSYAAIT